MKARVTVTLKAVTKMILTRVEETLNCHEDTSQTGFRKTYCTLDSIHALRQLAEKTSEYHLPLYVALVDFRKAFDTVEWSAVWEALYAHGVHVTLIHTLRRLYEASRTLITVNGDRVEVPVQRGVR